MSNYYRDILVLIYCNGKDFTYKTLIEMYNSLKFEFFDYINNFH